ncbi:hypothetical protein S4054249_25530 [Pseudoalteromonas luteoviolacea]|uniref:Sel1 repeat family protein n=1 Tax=Pseudoalteromonas luteoviolacea S4054 TaxID=1129367 RepID=A0A0F6AEC3_9GAMM|nr:hypothetical protein S4054249_25530 [Pseudoalteromonas luteoviolacea]AOT15645.1 hypothetical protein S40542_22980 [Pseudoalteromonas luteoviolacea]AOT21012.1 hypothetical protein S4054_25450 [Pseudoalteromonas luteoviolacea]KKE84540.1 hypothetical protein N479_08220 [Pseudoalteromonas luteoviolacea S4054]KZN71315.1 hypothetical protein N481_19200 [Pseudoalteromonas luteoviolacea S4047-1]
MFLSLPVAYHLHSNPNEPLNHNKDNSINKGNSLIKIAKPESSASTNLKHKIKQPNTTEQGRHQLVIKAKPKWQQDSNFKVHFDKLNDEAKSGNLKSKYIIAQNLKYCLFSPENEDDLNIKLEQLSQFSDASISIDQAINQFNYCQGLSNDETKAYYSYLEDAAKNGFVPAQEAFANIHAEFYMKSKNITTENRALYIKTRDKFKEQRLVFLRNASQHGSEKAIMALSNLYFTQQQSDEHGFAKSYALNKLIMEITDSDDIYNRYSWYEQKQYANMSEEELEYAFAMVEQWLQIIKTNGTLYPSNR